MIRLQRRSSRVCAAGVAFFALAITQPTAFTQTEECPPRSEIDMLASLPFQFLDLSWLGG